MLAAAGSCSGCSCSARSTCRTLGWGPLPTGLAFIPLALAAGIGAHAAGHLISRHGVRARSPALALAAVGMVLLPASAHGSYLRDMLPGMLMAGFGLGVAAVSVSIAILTGARHEEAGMISGLNSTGHEIGGTLGIAIFASIAAGAAAASSARRRRPGSLTRS